ncbi:MAG: serine/threonine protein kinase [Acidobacteriota bacterium]
MARPGTMPAGTKLGRYEVLRHLADGGMAQLLLARSTGIEGFERHVVIKRIHADQARDKQHVDMFLDEARLAASLHHHNIVQVHDVGQENGEYFFAMEYVHGEDARKLLTLLNSRRQQLPLAQIITIICGVADGLHYAHEMHAPGGKPMNIVHRDVSPANVLVGYDGNVKIVDFGIAKASLRSAETQSGTLKGKVAYMSPEQCMGLPIDRRADVYALGIVLWELSTVRRLFKGASEFLTMTSIVSGKIPRPSDHRKDLPKAFEAIVMKALATKPDERYQSCDELRLALEEFAHEQGLRTGTTALATYMVDTFGRRTEPWLIESDDPVIEVVDVDFDGSASNKNAAVELDDLAIPGSVWEAKSSPIMKAREKARQTGEPVFRTPPVGVPVMPAAKSTADDSSGFSPPSEQPTTGSVTPMAWSPSEPVEAAAPVASSRKRWLLAAGIAGPIALVAIILIATRGGSNAAARVPAPAPAPAVAPPPPVEPAPPPPAEPAPPPPVEPAPPPPAEPAPAAPVAQTAPAPAPAAAKPKPVPAKKRPAPRDPKKPKASWDPNALFPK